MKLKIIAITILTIMIMNVAIILIPENNVQATDTKSNTQKIANIVVFVEFQDTDHTQHNTKCFTNNEDTTFQYFNGEDGYEKGLKTYINKVSYGQLDVENIFPQYNETTKKITPYKASKNKQYYETNVSELIGEIIADINNNGTIKDNQILDYNNDGNIDNLTLVLSSGDNVNESSYKSSYVGSASIKGKFVNSYNVLREGLVYGTLQNSGVIIHEFLHTLGYPDLYRGGTNDGVPVGPWDIMASVNTFVQYPLAYFRSAITNWFTIPTVTESKKNYTLYAASKTTYETRNQQAVIIKTPYSDTEFFVVEYRKKENDNNSYDSRIPGSGLIVYRINLESVTNMKGDSSKPYNPDVAYVFRPDDTLDENGHEKGEGDIFKSFISAESETKSYGSRDLICPVTDGAITYSDGQNSGIIIENVGSSAGDHITFDITILDGNQHFWKNVTTKNDEKITYMNSYMDNDGSIYYLTQNINNKIQLYRYGDNEWLKIGNEISEKGTEHKILKYNNEFYIVYNLEVSNGNYNTKLLKLNNNTWQEVYKFPESHSGNYVAVDADETGIYFAIPNADYSKLHGYKYNNTVTDLGEIASSNYLSNTDITVENGNVAVLYREFMNNNKINVKLYKNNSWSNIETSMNANSAKIKFNNNKIYLLKNGETYEKNGAYVYTYDINNQDGWKQFGNNTFSDKNVSEMDICFNGDEPYIVYQEADGTQINVKHVKLRGWEQWLRTVSNAKANNIQIHIHKNRIYVNYITQKTQVIYTKSEGTSNIVIDDEDKPNIYYKTHVQDIGWQDYVKNGELSGTVGKEKRLEGISIYIDPEHYGSVLYRTQVQNLGWEDAWASFGGVSGTQGKSLRLEGIQIKLQGEIADNWNVYYRVQIQDYGWLDWAKNGESAGSEGLSKRLEGIEIKLVKNGEPAPGNTKNPFMKKQVIYQTQIQDIGWQDFVCNGEVSGTSGRSLRLEGIKIQLNNQKYNGGIEYKTHIQDIGWETLWKSNGEMSGTAGRSLRLEAIKIQLTGDMAQNYDIYYRVHSQEFGWLGWARNGEPAGTAGFSYRLEGIQIQLVEKGGEPPYSEGECYKERRG